jgi:hypothetical protein
MGAFGCIGAHHKWLIPFCILMFSSSWVFAQENSVESDTIPSSYKEYIDDHKKQLNVKFEVSNDINEFSLEDNGTALSLKPNLNLRYAFVFSYKFLSVRLGLRPNTSKEDQENKGESDTYRLRIQLLFDNWSHLLQYDYDRGFYLDNTSVLLTGTEPARIQFPYMTTNLLFGTSVYKFNPNYSIRAIESQTEIQIKSAGTFVLGASYNVYKLVGFDRILLPGEDIQQRDFYNEYYGVSLSATGGYYYTYVLKKNWFLNGFAQPSAGIDMHQTKTTEGDQQQTIHGQDFFSSLDYGLGIGYNGRKFFFGGEIRNRWANERSNRDQVKIQPQKNTFSVYAGYRFRAPKPVSAPVDMIEKKVPILKDEKN